MTSVENGVRRAFVLMPFDAEFSSVYSDLIKPALENAGYEVERADEPLERQNVLRTIVRRIHEAELIVADLTGGNPNVFYELGIAHGLGRPTVLITQTSDGAPMDVPFDLRSYRIEFYSTRFDEIGELALALETVGKEHLAGKVVFGNPVSDFVAADVGAKETDDGNDLGQPVEDEEPGWLDYLEELEDAAERIGETMQRMGQATEDVREDLQRSTERAEELARRPSGASTYEQRKVVSIAASDLTRYAERLEQSLPLLDPAVKQLTDSGLAYLSQAYAETEDQRKELGEAAQALSDLSEATTEGLEGLREFRQTVGEIPHVTKEFRRAARRVVKALDSIALLLEQSVSFAENGSSLIKEKLE